MIVTDEITMDEPTHTYWDRRGRRVVGFSELASHFGFVGGFAREEALKRGRNAHLAIHYFEKGKLGLGPGLKNGAAGLSDRIRPYFESYMGFRTLFPGRLILTETKVFDPTVRLACTLDSAWEMEDGTGAVIDQKTGPVHWWVAYQTAAQANGLGPRKDGRPWRRYGLFLCDDGRPGILKPFDDLNDHAMIRMYTSIFNDLVNHNVIKWPQTMDDLIKQRSEEYGLDQLSTDPIPSAV